MGPERIKGFDGLRALAVVGVFLDHRSPLSATHIGQAGVDVFFGLSGFLIVGLLHAARLKTEASQSTSAHELWRFMRHRFGRIFPIYYLALAVLAGLAIVGIHVSGWDWSALPWLVFYRANTWIGHLGVWPGSMSHLWSLSIEEWFYIFAAPAFLLTPARRHVILCATVVMVGMAWHAWLVVSHAPTIGVGTDSLVNYGFLALGGLLRLARPKWAAPILWPLVAVLCAVALIPETLGGAAWLFVVPPIGGLLVLAVAERQESPLIKALEFAPLVYLGRISYGFYLYHNLFWINAPMHGAAGVLAGMALNFAATLVLATASWFLIEKPILARVRAAGIRKEPHACVNALKPLGRLY